MRNHLRQTITVLERYAKTDLRYLIKGGGVLMVGQIGVSLIGLTSSIAFANLLPKENYGTYQYILSTAELLATFSLIGLSRVLITSTARGYDGTLSYAFKKGMVWGLGAIALGLLVGGYYAYMGNMVFGLGIAIGTTCTLLIANAKMYLSFLNGKKYFGLTSMSVVVGLLLPALFLIPTLFLTDNLLILLFVYFVTNTITNLGLYLFAHRYVENDRIDPHTLEHATHLSAQSFIGRIAATIDRILLFQFAGPVALAEYWVAQNIQRNFSHLFKSANGVVLPKVSTRSLTALRSGLPRKITLLYIIILPFTLAYIFATPYLITLVFPLYQSTILPTQVFGLLFLFLPIQVLADTLVGHGMQRALYHITIAGSVTKLTATVTLVPIFGLWGIIAALVIEQVALSLVTLWYFFKDTKTPHVPQEHT